MLFRQTPWHPATELPEGFDKHIPPPHLAALQGNLQPIIGIELRMAAAKRGAADKRMGKLKRIDGQGLDHAAGCVAAGHDQPAQPELRHSVMGQLAQKRPSRSCTSAKDRPRRAAAALSAPYDGSSTVRAA